MGQNGQSGKGSTIIPCLRYRDALAAIDWLQRASVSMPRPYTPTAIPCSTPR